MTSEKERLLTQYCANRSDIKLRDSVFEAYLPLVAMTARQFSGRGVDYDDLYQVGALALLKALTRFDPQKGVKFVTFATPTVVGEIKNFFRDRSRLISLPRRSGMLMKRLEQARDELTKVLQRTPTALELAEHVGERLEVVLETMEMQGAVSPASLDAAVIDEDDEMNLYSVLGFEEKGYLEIEQRDMVRRAMAKLSDTDRTILMERFFRNRSQREVAEMMGVSQMTISRNERKAIDRFRELVGDENR